MGTSLKNKDRPKYLNLAQINLPITGIVSILHRVSGVLLILSIPFLLYLLQLSLTGPDGYNEAVSWLSSPIVALLTIVLMWAVAHHFFAGIRHLLFDFDIGVEKVMAQRLAKLVFIAEAVFILLLFGWWL